MRKISLFFLLLVAWGAAGRLPAQEKGAEVAAPFVSRLKAQAGELSILLTWRDSPDVKGYRQIYRCSEEIDEDSFTRATLIARLPADTNSYEDSPPDLKPYYYAVLLEDAQGSVHKLFIPFRNKTSAGARAAGLAPEENLATRITGIAAVVAEDAVRISFQSSRPERSLLLFRSGNPMRTSADLLDAASPVTLEANSKEFLDYPIPGIGFYYAVLDAGLFKIGKARLVDGENSTAGPVQVPLGVGRVGLPAAQPGAAAPQAAPSSPSTSAPAAQAAGEPAAAQPAVPAAAPATSGPEAARLRRPAPLPYLSISAEVGPRQEQLPARIDRLQPGTAKAIEWVLVQSPAPGIPKMQPLALPADQSTTVESEAYGLQAILNDLLLKKDFSSAATKLLAFLSIPRTDGVAARGHFYLAQAYFFQERYRQAFLEFLMARNLNYQAVQPWLDACLYYLPRP